MPWKGCDFHSELNGNPSMVLSREKTWSDLIFKWWLEFLGLGKRPWGEGQQSQKQGDPVLGAYCNIEVTHDGGFKGVEMLEWWEMIISRTYFQVSEQTLLKDWTFLFYVYLMFLGSLSFPEVRELKLSEKIMSLWILHLFLKIAVPRKMKFKFHLRALLFSTCYWAEK